VRGDLTRGTTLLCALNYNASPSPFSRAAFEVDFAPPLTLARTSR